MLIEAPVQSATAADLAGVDALDLPVRPVQPTWRSLWANAWPRITAALIALALWQAIALSGWKPSYVLPGPGPVLRRFTEGLADLTLIQAAFITLRRAFAGYALAALFGMLLGLAVARNRTLRIALGSMITGLQTMPTIAWFPLAILLFGLTESAILFVVVLGAAPAIANGIISGVDHIPPILLRASRVLGARGWNLYRLVILPAALPGLVAGLKQGWAFAWRSLMAGELLVIIAAQHSLGVSLQFAREMSDAPALLATMLAVLIIGILIDSVFFARLEHFIRRRWGLL